MPNPKVFYKDPQEVLKYTFDWQGSAPGPYLTGGATISSSAITVGSGLTKDSEANTTTTATVTVSGGTEGQSYTVMNSVTISTGEVAQRSITITVKSK